MQLAHGTDRDHLVIHPGLCLVVSDTDPSVVDEAVLDRAAAYGRERDAAFCVHRFDLADDNLVVERVEVDLRAALDGDGFPGDRQEEIDAYLARGIDAIRFVDADPRGVAHETLRVFSARALRSLTVIEVLTADDF